MMNLHTLKQKRVLIVGLGVTGESVVRYLHTNNVMFDVVDERAEPKIELAQALLNAHMHKTLDAALCCAYDVLIISPGVPRSLPALSQALGKGVEVIGDIELFAHAIGDTPVIAVTGSNGKSTVVSWIAHVLKRCGKHVKLCGNIGTPALDSIDAEADVYVLELSSYQLESTTSLAALSATVLNISDDHMDRYASIEHYAAVKRRVYSNCQHIVVNLDDQRTLQQASDNAESSVNLADNTAFSLRSIDDARFHMQTAANDAWLCRGDEKLLRQSQLQVPGDHNVANALAVLALLEPINLDVNELLDGLSDFHGLEHRTEFVRTIHGVRWYNDSKGTNIDACKKAILAMSAPVVLIAGGMGKGADFQSLRAVVNEHVKALVLIGEDAQLIRTALDGTTQMVMAESLQQAVLCCADIATDGDVVLLSPACSSFDMFENFEQRGMQFKQAVEAIAA